MQQSEAFQRQLRAHYAAIVAESFDRARSCLNLARAAQQAGNCVEVRKWVWSARVLRMAAGEWRKRAQCITPVVLCALWCLVGCTKVSMPDPRELSANFEVQPLARRPGDRLDTAIQVAIPQVSRHYSGRCRACQGSRADSRRVTASPAACSAREKEVMKLGTDGIAFVGSCGSNPAHWREEFKIEGPASVQ
jgi:hypothetical protein